jgi:hypothetical protein
VGQGRELANEALETKGALMFYKATKDKTEPLFILPAGDPVCDKAIRAWAHLHRVNGGDDPSYESAMKYADEIEAWRKRKEQE